jgi:hypothetical protein
MEITLRRPRWGGCIKVTLDVSGIMDAFRGEKAAGVRGGHIKKKI